MSLSIFLTISLFAMSMAIERPYYQLDKVEEYFEEFMKMHEKSYSNAEEKQKRFEIFKENLNQINILNSFNESIHGITPFADLTDEEFDEQYNSCFGPEENFERSSCAIIRDDLINTNTAPATLDYRQKNAVSGVKNQNPCNSCWAFASVGSLEAQYALKHGQLLNFSPQQLMDCLKCSGHCARGSFMASAFSELMGTAGVQLESDYPYVAKDLRCRYEPAKAKVKVTGCFNFDLKNEDKLKEALYKYGPIAMGIDSKPLKYYNGSIVSARACPPNQPGHAVLLVGYGTENGQNYWLFKNSYGPKWGPLGGYFKLARGQNVCGMMNHHAASPTIA